jgi:protein subunit release factor B
MLGFCSTNFFLNFFISESNNKETTQEAKREKDTEKGIGWENQIRNFSF